MHKHPLIWLMKFPYPMLRAFSKLTSHRRVLSRFAWQFFWTAAEAKVPIGRKGTK